MCHTTVALYVLFDLSLEFQEIQGITSRALWIKLNVHLQLSEGGGGLTSDPILKGVLEESSELYSLLLEYS